MTTQSASLTTQHFLSRAARTALEEPLAVLEKIDDGALYFVPHATGNTIGWLAWHIFRTADLQMGWISGAPDVWAAQGLAARWPGCPAEGNASGQSTADAQALRVPSRDELIIYGRAVVARVVEAIEALDDAALSLPTRGFGPTEQPAMAAIIALIVAYTVRHQGEILTARSLHEQ